MMRGVDLELPTLWFAPTWHVTCDFCWPGPPCSYSRPSRLPRSSAVPIEPIVVTGCWPSDFLPYVWSAKTALTAVPGHSLHHGGSLRLGTWLIHGRCNAERAWVRSTATPQWSVHFGTHEYRVTRVIEYPGYSNKRGGVDLALFELDRPVDSTTPVPIYVGKHELGQMVTLVGFGGFDTFEAEQSERFANGVAFLASPTRERIKRAGTNVIISVGDTDQLILRVDPPESATELEASVAGGDSGGPALLPVNGKMYLAGVISSMADHRPASEDRAGVYGARFEVKRVSSFARWIEDTTGERFGAVRYDRNAAAVGLVLLVAVSGYFWLARRLGPLLRVHKGGKVLLKAALPLTMAGGVVATGYVAWFDVTSPAVLAFVPMVMLFAAIGIRYAAGTFRDKSSRQSFLFVGARTLHHSGNGGGRSRCLACHSACSSGRFARPLASRVRPWDCHHSYCGGDTIHRKVGWFSPRHPAEEVPPGLPIFGHVTRNAAILGTGGALCPPSHAAAQHRSRESIKPADPHRIIAPTITAHRIVAGEKHDGMMANRRVTRFVKHPIACR